MDRDVRAQGCEPIARNRWCHLCRHMFSCAVAYLPGFPFYSEANKQIGIVESAAENKQVVGKGKTLEMTRKYEW